MQVVACGREEKRVANGAEAGLARAGRRGAEKGCELTYRTSMITGLEPRRNANTDGVLNISEGWSWNSEGLADLRGVLNIFAGS